MIGLIGINHKSAPIAIREKFAFTPDQIRQFSRALLASGNFTGCVVLSTCNRTEIYYEGTTLLNGAAPHELTKALMKFKNIQEDISEHFYSLGERQAVYHLLEVICGFDSLALGEYQIVGQVKEAYRQAELNETTGKGLTRLFQKSFETSKKVRTETEMNRGAASVSYAAVELAAKTFSDLRNKRILLVGAGETSELVLLHLRKRATHQITIVNRTQERAEKLAERYNGLALPFEQLEQALAQADIILTSTASQVALVDVPMVQRVMEQRQHAPLFFVDLSVPRNVAAEVENIPGVSVKDVDDLQAVVAETFERRKSQIDAGKQIIDELAHEFFDWRSAQQLAPTLQAIHLELQALQRSEVEGFRKANNGAELDLEKFGERIAQKYAHMLARNIRELTQNGRDQESLKIVHQLFQL